MKGVWLLPGVSKDVAVKTLKEGSSEEDTVKFLQEAAIHGQFWHPNVVKLMGVVTVGEPVSGLDDYCAILIPILSNLFNWSYYTTKHP